jgi:hypothetical protein
MTNQSNLRYLVSLRTLRFRLTQIPSDDVPHGTKVPRKAVLLCLVEGFANNFSHYVDKNKICPRLIASSLARTSITVSKRTLLSPSKYRDSALSRGARSMYLDAETSLFQ